MPFQVTQQNEPNTITVTIANGTDLSPVFRIPFGRQLAAIIMPAAWTAADITFKSGYNTAIHPVYDTTATEIAFTVVANHYVPIPPNTLNGLHRMKLQSGTRALNVNQLAERVLTLITRPVA